MIKKTTPYIVASSLFVSLTAQGQETSEAVKAEAAPKPAAVTLSPEEVKKNSSYWFGYRNGREFSRQLSQGGLLQGDLDQEMLQKGIQEGISGKKPDVSEEKLQASLQQFAQMMEEREKKLAESNLEKGNQFLAENKKREGVITTESGLQYEVLKKGEGEVVNPSEEESAGVQFLVNYKGMLPDGTVFDQSPEGQPVPMPLQVIPGFKEALTMMPMGSKWKLFIPSSLAYGPQRAGNLIGPNQVLIFDLEVLKVVRPGAPAPGTIVPPAPEGKSE